MVCVAIMAERTRVIPLQAKAWLVLAYSHSFPTLSVNILREICLYIGPLKLLPCLLNNTLRLYDIDSRKGTVVHLSRNFYDAWIYCNIEDKDLLAVDTSEVVAINLKTFKISSAGKLNAARDRAGLGWAAPFVYVFGGLVPYSHCTTCEKLQWGTKVWRVTGHMKWPKDSFTPCRVRDEFYLCCLDREGKPFEAFNLTTETFRDLPVAYRSNTRFGSMTCLVGDSLYIVASEGLLLQWKLGNAQLEPVRRIDFTEDDEDLGASNSPPVCVGRKIYWVYFHGGYVVSLDLDTERFEVNWGK